MHDTTKATFWHKSLILASFFQEEENHMLNSSRQALRLPKRGSQSTWHSKCSKVLYLAAFLLNVIFVKAFVTAVQLPPRFHRQQQQNNRRSTNPSEEQTTNTEYPIGATSTQRSAYHQPFPFEVGSMWIATLERFKSMLRLHLHMQRRTYQKIGSILLYKPPVGIFTVYTIFQLVASGRIFRLYDRPQSRAGQGQGEGVMQEEHRKPKRRVNRGRALNLEEEDQSYHSYGVIERVRGRLCVAALSEIVQQQQQEGTAKPAFSSPSDSTDSETQNQHFQTPWVYATALEALQISCPPGGSRSDYLYKLKDLLSQLRAANAFSEANKKQGSLPQIVKIATMTIEVRATDAVLRVARDRLLKTTYRLGRTVKYWNRRVEQANALTVVQQRIMRGTIDGDRLRLSYAQAAYDAELKRLGRICAMLMLEKKDSPSSSSGRRGRPMEMDDSHLLRALKKSHGERPPNQSWSEKKAWRQTWRLPKISRYSLRFERGRPVLRHLEKDTYIEGSMAMDVLLEDDKESMEDWYADAADWIKTARTVLCNVLEESLDATVASEEHDSRIDDLQSIKKAWEINEQQGNGSVDFAMNTYSLTNQAWGKALYLVEDMRYHRRVGEGKTVHFRDLSIVGFLRDFDLFGIPSALAKIYLAHLIYAWASPYYPAARKISRETWEAAVTIFMTRFYEPGKEVVMDILNRSKNSMMDDFNLKNEEHSLDVMLKDLNLGDGTPENRQQAIEKASRAYENDLKSGLFRHAASGHLVRLLLVQVQQLKVGMLNAVGDIDVLLQANQLNVRILATIPAILIVSFGSRFIARNLYNFRSRDLRSVTDVHEEMTGHLNRMKSILLLGKGGEDEDKGTGDIVSSAVTALGASELGEFALSMHCYLVLLDYTSPQPFPKAQCDDIHRSLREVLGSLRKRRSGGSEVKDDRPLALVDVAIKKHEDLRRHL